MTTGCLLQAVIRHLSQHTNVGVVAAVLMATLILLADIPAGQVSAGLEHSQDSVTTRHVPPSTPANRNVTSHPSPQVETSIASDPTDAMRVVAVWKDHRFADPFVSTVGMGWSTDGATTWSTFSLRTEPSQITPWAQYESQTDPSVAAYRSNVFYAVILDFWSFDYQLLRERQSRIIVGRT